MEDKDDTMDPTGRSDPIPQYFLRLQTVLESENEFLRTRSTADPSDYIERKNHALLEIQRVIAGLSEQELKERAGAHLKALRDVVRVNAELLLMQLDAVREVSEILRSAIHVSESDGTYSANFVKREQMS